MRFWENKIGLVMQGGLGNQLFQLMAGLSALLERNYNCLQLDFRNVDTIGAHDRSDLRDLDLSELSELISLRSSTKLRIGIEKGFFKVSNLFNYPERKKWIFEPNQNGHVQGFPANLNHRWIKGFFQTWQYAKNVEAHLGIRFNENLKLRSPSIEFLKLQRQMAVTKPIAIHIRRGDYHKKRETFGVLADGYYAEGISKLAEIYQNKEVWIFTNSDTPMDSFKERIGRMGLRTHLVPRSLSSAETLLLLTHGGSHIISNSSFGWWGAVLSAESKNIFYPDKWFRSKQIPKDLVPPNSKWTPLPARWM